MEPAISRDTRYIHRMDTYTYEIRSGGGMGRAAIWEWSVYKNGKPAAIESGEVKGAQSKADIAGRQAVARWKAKRAKK